jgi:hypothetical protein
VCERGVIDSLIDNKLAVQPRQDTLPPILKVALWRGAGHHSNAQIEDWRITRRDDYEAAAWFKNTLHFVASLLPPHRPR